MRLLGLDIGNARTGIALSDEQGITARPLEVVGIDELPGRLKSLVAEHQVETVVVGRPRHLDGSLGEQAAEIDRIVEHVKPGVEASFVYEDETGTTKLGGGDDADAACVILQGYLDEQARS